MVQLITAFQLGGAELVAFRLAQQCTHVPTASGVKTVKHTLVAIHDSEGAYSTSFRKACHDAGIDTLVLWAGTGKVSVNLAKLLAWTMLPKVLSRLNAHLVHSHTDIPDFTLAMAMQLAAEQMPKLPVVRTIHNEILWPTRPLLAKWTEKAFSNDHVVGISEATLLAYRALRTRTGQAESPAQQVILNPRPLAAMQGQAQAWHPASGVPLRMLFAGRLVHQKGFDLLVKAINQLPAGLPLELYIFGDGDMKAMRMELKCKYQYIMPVFNLSEAYNQYHLLLMPSRFEGAPLAIGEAAAAKLPVLATDLDGIRIQTGATYPGLVPLVSDETEQVNLWANALEKVMVQGTDQLQKELPESTENHSIEDYQMLYATALGL